MKIYYQQNNTWNKDVLHNHTPPFPNQTQEMWSENKFNGDQLVQFQA